MVPYARLVSAFAFVTLLFITVVTLRLETMTLIVFAGFIVIGIAWIVRTIRQLKRLVDPDYQCIKAAP